MTTIRGSQSRVALLMAAIANLGASALRMTANKPPLGNPGFRLFTPRGRMAGDRLRTDRFGCSSNAPSHIRRHSPKVRRQRRAR